MMSDLPLLLGIDIGTTNIKTIVFAPNGRTVAQVSVPTPTHYGQPGWATYDAEETWQTVVTAIRAVLSRVEDRRRIRSVGVTSYGETGVPIDHKGDPTYAAIAWFDNRTVAQGAWLAEVIGQERLFQITGVALQPILGLCKLLWLRDHAPDAFARTTCWLNMADYIAYRLCGVAATDFSLASRMLCLDLHGRCWANDLVQAVGLSPTLLAPLLPGGTHLGALLPAVATATGLPAHTQVAVGGHDHVCAALALGVTQPGDLLNSVGTAEAIFLPVTAPVTDPAYGAQGYTQGVHLAGGYYIFGGLYTSGASVDWFRTQFAGAVDHQTLIAEASAVAAGSEGALFLPHLRQSSPPHLNLAARGAFIGLHAEMTRGVLFHALVEGLAYELRYSLEPLLAYGHFTNPGTIYVAGGGAHNCLYNQIKASVLNQPLRVVGIKEATALGAALLGGVGAGVYPTIPAALAQIEDEPTLIEPQASAAAYYATAYQQVYRRLYTTLASLYSA